MAEKAAAEFGRSWHIVLAGWIGAIFGFNGFAYASFSVLMDPLAKAFGQGLPAISGWVTAYFVGNLTASPVLGYLADRIGARRIILCAIPCFALAWALASTLGPAMWLFYTLGFLAGSAGTGASPLTYGRVINTWFSAGRGTALGIMSMGIGLSYLFGPRLVQHITDLYGWRSGFLLIAAANLIPLPLSLAWMREKREAVRATAVSVAVEAGYTVSQAVCQPVFWLMGSALICYGLSAGGVTVNMVSFLSSSGLTRVAAASYVSLLGVFSMAGRVVTGFIIDRLHASSVCCAILIMEALAFCVFGAFSARFAWIAVPATGFAFGGEVCCIGYLVARFFGVKHYGVIQGCLTLISSIGVALGPPLFGLLRQHSGSYTLPFFVAGGIAFVAAGCFAISRTYPFFTAPPAPLRA